MLLLIAWLASFKYTCFFLCSPTEMSDNETINAQEDAESDPLGRSAEQIWFEVSLAILICLVAFTGKSGTL